VSKTLRSSLRYAGDAGGLRPPAAALTHLSEYVLRLALREHWDLADTPATGDRLRRLMFDTAGRGYLPARSELAEMAALSGMVFVGGGGGDSAVDVEEVRPITAGASVNRVKHVGRSTNQSSRYYYYYYYYYTSGSENLQD